MDDDEIFGLGLVKSLVLGENVSCFTNIRTNINQRLMSGAMWTTLQNTLLNLIIMSYLKFRSTGNRNFDLTSDDIMVEGDDGIMRSFGWKENVIRRLGLDLKIERHKHFSTASFCGRVLTEEGTCLTEPNKFFEKLQWFDSKQCALKEKNKLALLKYKCMSAYEEFRLCPVIGPSTYYIINELRSIDHRAAYRLIDPFLVKRMGKPEPISDISPGDRSAFECLYGFGISEQITTENNFRLWKPGISVQIRHDVPKSWIKNHLELQFIDKHYQSEILTHESVKPG